MKHHRSLIADAPESFCTPRFELGQTVATPAALEVLKRVGVSPLELLRRHLRFDPGTLCVEDQESNRHALLNGARIFSAYTVGPDNEPLWVITDAADDNGLRASTCILRPQDY